jgi:hypothetical protein
MIPRGISSGNPTRTAEETDEQFEARLAHEARRIARAIRSVREGRVVRLTKMAEWADSLGTAHILPLPRARRLLDRQTVIGAASLADEACESLDHIEWWYSRPGDDAESKSVKRVRAIVSAMVRLAETRDRGLPGAIRGTRELVCQSHRIVYVVVRRDRATGNPGDVVVFDIFGPAQPR